MSAFSKTQLILILILLKCVLNDSIELLEEEGTCNQTFNFFKNTQASSNSERECINGFNIFPYIHDEGANKFQDGLCAYQCKLELPFTCFAVHAPQTPQHDEGTLKVEILEKKMTQKWKYVLDNIYNFNYDLFFDFNMAFWVQSLDDYILHWNTFKGYNQDDIYLNKLEYIGIEWYVNINSKNTQFYSILIHSPFSAINYEFISQNKPSIGLYNDIKWIQSDIARCSFKSMNNPLPWNRNDNAYIVPLRLSHAVTDINIIYDFYINVMGATVVYHQHTETIETFSISLINTQIEIQFIKRESSEAFGDFSLEVYEELLMETHSSIITSPYCGIDRWFDNHYGYKTYGISGYMDEMINNLNNKNMIYKLYKLPYEHSSVLMKKEMDYYQLPTQYGAIVIDPTGQTIEVNGWISDRTMQRLAPVANPQWCSMSCYGNMVQGIVDPQHVYVDSEDVDSNIIGPTSNYHHYHQDYLLSDLIVAAIICFVICISGIIYYKWCRKSPSGVDSNQDDQNNETTPLI